MAVNLPLLLFITHSTLQLTSCFQIQLPIQKNIQSLHFKSANTNSNPTSWSLKAGRGFGAPPPKKKKRSSISDTTTPNTSETDKMLADLAAAAAKSPLGRAISPTCSDPFYEMVPSLIHTRFPAVPETEVTRIAGFLSHATDPTLSLEESIINDPFRPHEEIHAYMPGLPPTKPFHDPDTLQLCRELKENYPIILQEYEALLKNKGIRKRFQSVTSMNYESGWKTLVLFYNGHRIDDFPYQLCPVTTRIMESVPLAGRIAGFNRQQPGTGIPLHSDGNNMWLTCQMGIKVPKGNKAYIRVGPETKHWSEGECLLYDTTYEHETMNESADEERVVLHIDFFNTLAMTPLEIEIMQYIYQMREAFMKAEGVAKVGAQIL